VRGEEGVAVRLVAEPCDVTCCTKPGIEINDEGDTEFDCGDAGPLPFGFTAVTVNV
jgi:hypothetical protein